MLSRTRCGVPNPTYNLIAHERRADLRLVFNLVRTGRVTTDRQASPRE